MSWSVTSRIMAWPAELQSVTYQKANKKKELTDLLKDLDTAAKQHAEAASTYPFAPGKVTTPDAAQRWAEVAAQYFSAPKTKKLAGSLKVIGKRAQELANKNVSTEAKKAAAAIAGACDTYAKSLELKNNQPTINAHQRKLIQDNKKETLDGLRDRFATFKAVTAKGHPGLVKAQQIMKTWPRGNAEQIKARQDLQSAIYDDSRDMTQNVMALVKAMSYGADLTQFGLQQRDVATLPKIGETLTPWANAKGSFTVGRPESALVTMVKTLAANAKLYDQIAARLP
jgi:hypothetical protein